MVGSSVVVVVGSAVVVSSVVVSSSGVVSSSVVVSSGVVSAVVMVVVYWVSMLVTTGFFLKHPVTIVANKTEAIISDKILSIFMRFISITLSVKLPANKCPKGDNSTIYYTCTV